MASGHLPRVRQLSPRARASAQFGVRALRTKGRAEASKAAIDLIPPLLLVAGGVALAAFSIYRWTVLYVLFAGLGVAIGVTHLRFWLTPPAHARAVVFLAHMSGMGTSCITTVTAFVVVNARSFGMRTFDLAVWAGPIAVLAVGLADLAPVLCPALHTERSCRVAPPGSSKSCPRTIAACSRTRKRMAPSPAGPTRLDAVEEG